MINPGGLLDQIGNQTGEASSPVAPRIDPAFGLLRGLLSQDRTVSGGGNSNSSPLSLALQPEPSALPPQPNALQPEPSAIQPPALDTLTGDVTDQADGFDTRSLQQFARDRLLGIARPPQNTPSRA